MAAHWSGGRKGKVFKSVFAELNHQMQEDKSSKPEAPHHHFLHSLDIQHSKNENELVENKIPKLVFEMLSFTHSKRAEHNTLDKLSHQHQNTASSIHQNPHEQAVRQQVLGHVAGPGAAGGQARLGLQWGR